MGMEIHKWHVSEREREREKQTVKITALQNFQKPIEIENHSKLYLAFIKKEKK